MGRFVNADGEINGQNFGTNLFVYCGNNPIIRTDPSGDSFLVAMCIITAITGIIACASPAGQARTQEVISNPSVYSVGNWLTMGMFDTVKGAIMPEKPLSLQHWVDSAATATMLIPAVSYVDDAIRGISTSAKVVNAPTNRANVASSTTIPTKVNKVSHPPRFDGNQNAVIQLAKENRKGISMSNAQILQSWGQEYGVRAEIHMGHQNRPSPISQNPHFHFGNGSDHVPIFRD